MEEALQYLIGSIHECVCDRVRACGFLCAMYSVRVWLNQCVILSICKNQNNLKNISRGTETDGALRRRVLSKRRLCQKVYVCDEYAPQEATHLSIFMNEEEWAFYITWTPCRDAEWLNVLKSNVQSGNRTKNKNKNKATGRHSIPRYWNVWKLNNKTQKNPFNTHDWKLLLTPCSQAGLLAKLLG